LLGRIDALDMTSAMLWLSISCPIIITIIYYSHLVTCWQNLTVRANFGASPFVYADVCGTHSKELMRELRDTFVALPFHISSDHESDEPDSPTTPTAPLLIKSSSPTPIRSIPCRSATVAKPLDGMKVFLITFLQMKL